MKGFAKIIELENRDVLVKKHYDDEDDGYGIQLITFTDEGEITFFIGIVGEKERDRKFDELNEEIVRALLLRFLPSLLKG